jgi:WhiB family redox-sensing transcriptional regulator
MATHSQVERAMREPAPSPRLIGDDVIDGADGYTVDDPPGRRAALWLAGQVLGEAGDSKHMLAELLDILGLLPAPEPLPAAQPAKPRRAPRQPSILDQYAWSRRAVCKGEPLETFYGVDGERGDAKAEREYRAKAFCRVCPVARACLEHALASGDKYGIRGGLNEEERHSEHRRRMRRKAAEGRAA